MWVGVTLAVLFAFHAWAPAAEAQDPLGTTPPPGNCWNGALSKEPLHCYILEEAQRAGRIEVAAVYQEPGYAPLWVYLAQTAPLSDDVGAYLRDKAHEYITSSTRRSDYRVERCDGSMGDARKSCLDSLIGDPTWWYFYSPLEGGLPPPSAYSHVLLQVGGVDARRSRPGWATWKQWWPTVTGFGEAGSASGSGGFDVSDVDVTNIPKPDCEDARDIDTTLRPSCRGWQDSSEPGFAGMHTDRHNPEGKTIHVQLTTAIPKGETELEALRQRVAPGYEAFDFKVEFVRVKYDFGQLWRWSVILDRFSRSAGNTIGIMGAEVDTNLYIVLPPPYAYDVWLNGAKPVGRDETGISRDWSTARNILTVWAEKSSIGGVVSALPRLLPALGIPADAVGLVQSMDYSYLREGVRPAIGGEGTVPVAPQPAGAPADTPGAGDNSQPAANVTDTAPNDPTESGPPPPGVAAPSPSPTSSSRWVVVAAAGGIVAATLAALLMARRRGH